MFEEIVGSSPALQLFGHEGPKGVAARLGIPRQTLESKIKALRIDRLAFRAR